MLSTGGPPDLAAWTAPCSSSSWLRRQAALRPWHPWRHQPAPVHVVFGMPTERPSARSASPTSGRGAGPAGPRLLAVAVPRDVGHDPQGGRVRGDRDVGQGAHRRWPHAVRHAGRGAPGGGGHGKAHAGHFVNVHDLIGMSPEPLGIATIIKVTPHGYANVLHAQEEPPVLGRSTVSVPSHIRS